MKVKYYINLLFLFSFSLVYAQDLIVKTNGDSLNCKIKKVKPDYIHYELNSLQAVLRSNQIKSYQKGFYKNPASVSPTVNLQGFRFGVYGGWSYLLGRVDKSLPPFLYNYTKALKSGYHLSADAGYFFKGGVGFGIKYSRFISNNKYDGKIYIIDTLTNQKKVGDMSDDITIQYFAPAFMGRAVIGKTDLEITSDFSLGYFAYKNKATVVDSYTLTSGTLGYSLSFGLHYPVVKNVYVGLDFCYYNGVLYSYTYDDGKSKREIQLSVTGQQKPQNISRIDLSATIQWFF